MLGALLGADTAVVLIELLGADTFGNGFGNGFGIRLVTGDVGANPGGGCGGGVGANPGGGCGGGVGANAGGPSSSPSISCSALCWRLSAAASRCFCRLLALKRTAAGVVPCGAFAQAALRVSF